MFLSVFHLKNNEALLNIDQPLQEMGLNEFFWELNKITNRIRKN